MTIDGSLAFLAVALGLFILAAVPWMMAHGARTWSQAASAAHAARAHGIQADETGETLREAREAVMQAVPRQDNYHPPTDEELAWGARMSANGQLDREYNTAGEADLPDELNAHMSGGEFR